MKKEVNMGRSKTWCWIHMEDPCYYCELDQLKKIVEDATKACLNNWTPGEIQVILERPIKPSMIEFEEDEDGVMYQVSEE
jgi:hypothetical protein